MRYQAAMKIGFFGLLIGSLFFLTGCSGAFTDWFAPLPTPPHKIIADAGPDQTVEVSALVTLDGSASFALICDYDRLTFLWTQVAGPPVTLSDPTAVRPTFTPPVVGTYTFRLVVTVGKVVSAPDYVTIFVVTHIINVPPTAVITYPVHCATFDEEDVITFKGSAIDPEDGPLTGASLVWTSSRDGEIGIGEFFTRTLSAGTHIITLTATDSHGAVGTYSVVIRVTWWR